MSDKSRERLYLPEFELEEPGTKFVFFAFLADGKPQSGMIATSGPSGKGWGLTCKEVQCLSGVWLLVITEQETPCSAPSYSFFCAGQTYLHRSVNRDHPC